MGSKTTLAATLAVGRLAFGAGLVVAPGAVAAPWIGSDARRPAVKAALRAIGVRDLALAAGALASQDDPPRLARWIAAGAACDLADVAITFAAPSSELPRMSREVTVAMGCGAGIAGLLLQRGLRDTEVAHF